jgi:hypothetical protein
VKIFFQRNLKGVEVELKVIDQPIIEQQLSQNNIALDFAAVKLQARIQCFSFIASTDTYFKAFFYHLCQWKSICLLAVCSIL